jgi:hypothetical protein
LAPAIKPLIIKARIKGAVFTRSDGSQQGVQAGSIQCGPVYEANNQESRLKQKFVIAAKAGIHNPL